MSEEIKIKRGLIKQYREILNAQPEESSEKHFHKSGNKTFQQRTRKYGDYLYNQDRDKFLWEVREWIAGRMTQYPDPK